MTEIKPLITTNDVFELLESLKIGADDVKEISEGRIARTFCFTTRDVNFYVQFNQPNMAQGTTNEILFKKEFKRLGIPSRPIVNFGNFKDYEYLITEEVVGTSYEQLDFVSLLTKTLEILKLISKCNVTAFNGYGWLNEKGDGCFDTWADMLNSVIAEDADDFYGNWHELFTTSFLDKSLFHLYFDKMKSLYSQLTVEFSNHRSLIHGGFCGGNILFDSAFEIVAVLDWQEARYGDPVYDAAYSSLWLDKDKETIFHNEYIKKFGITDRVNYFKRITCYQYYICLDGMKFAARTGNKEFYDYVCWLASEL